MNGYALSEDERKDLRDCKKYIMKKSKEELDGTCYEWEKSKLENFSIVAHITNDVEWQKQLKKDASVLDKVMENDV